jgi:hypothetical protein
VRAAARFVFAPLWLPVLIALAAAPAGAAPAARPEPGRHAAELCVATLPEPLKCGPAQADLRADGSLRLRVDDIVYALQLRSSQVEVVVMHNVVQIDEFTVPYEWVGGTLQFRDDDRNSRYEVRIQQGKSIGR